jgi:hypothetical protein
MRKVALRVVKGEADTPERISAPRLSELVGPPVYSKERLYALDSMPPGVVLGLAWTCVPPHCEPSRRAPQRASRCACMRLTGRRRHSPPRVVRSMGGSTLFVESVRDSGAGEGGALATVEPSGAGGSGSGEAAGGGKSAGR